MAPAANGMGVAYAQVGRYDLAQRFFEQAMSIDPGNVHYAENMSRLTLAMRHDADIASPAAKPAEQAIAAASGTPLLGKLQRISRGS